MSDRKRYGTYEQVNGGTLNDAYDEIERLQSQLDTFRERLDIQHDPEAGQPNDEIDRLRMSLEVMSFERDQWKEYADAGLESYKKDQAEISRITASLDTFRERWKAEQAKRVAVERRLDAAHDAMRLIAHPQNGFSEGDAVRVARAYLAVDAGAQAIAEEGSNRG